MLVYVPRKKPLAESGFCLQLNLAVTSVCRLEPPEWQCPEWLSRAVSEPWCQEQAAERME